MADQLIGETVPHDDLAATIAERREIGVIGCHDRTDLHNDILEELQIVVVVENVPIPCRGVTQ